MCRSRSEGVSGKYFVFLISQEKHVCCGYPLEVLQWDGSNECHNICFCRDIRKLLILFG